MRSKDLKKKERLLDVALRLAEEHGYHNLRRDAVASEAGVATGTLNLYFGTMNQLKRAVMRRAIKEGKSEIVSQGIALRDPVAMKGE